MHRMDSKMDGVILIINKMDWQHRMDNNNKMVGITNKIQITNGMLIIIMGYKLRMVL